MELMNKMVPDWFKYLEAYIPSLIGSAGSMLWLEGSITRKFWLFVLGFYAGYHTGFYLNELTNIPITLCWLTMGLYSVSVIDKFFDLLAKTNLLDFLPYFKKKAGGDK